MNEKEIELKERELDLEKERVEIERYKAEHTATPPGLTWSSPLVVAIFAGVLTLIGNAVISIVQSYNALRLETTKAELSRELELVKTEQTRILEMIKTGGNAEQAKKNLNFLLETGLIADKGIAEKLKAYFERTEPKDFPTLTSWEELGVGSIGGWGDKLQLIDIYTDGTNLSTVRCSEGRGSLTYDARWYSASVSDNDTSCAITFELVEALKSGDLANSVVEEYEFFSCEKHPVRFLTNVKTEATGGFFMQDNQLTCSLTLPGKPS